MLIATSPATDLTILTVQGLRLAAGLAAGDASKDEQLAPIGARAAADIVTVCRVAFANGSEPTLRREGLRQTLRMPPRRHALVLARRHQVEVSAIVVDGTALTDEQYEIDSEAGIAYRLAAGVRAEWSARVVVIDYQAGFSDVPPDLAGVASDLVRYRLSESSRDPLVRGERTDVVGVMETETSYWVGSVPGKQASGPVPSDIAARLQRYRNFVVS